MELGIAAHGFNTDRKYGHITMIGSMARLLYWCGCSEWEFVVEGMESLPAGEVVIEVVYSGVLVMGCGVRLDFPLPPSHGLLSAWVRVQSS